MTSNLHYIMRFCADDTNPDHRKVIRDGLTLEEAQAHCDDERTSGDGWFDGYQVGEPVSPVQQPTHTAPLPADLGGPVDVGRTATKPSEMGHDYTLTDEQLEAMSTREESAEVAAALPEPRDAEVERNELIEAIWRAMDQTNGDEAVVRDHIEQALATWEPS